MATGVEKQFFGPLTLHQQTKVATIFKTDEPKHCTCILCDEKFVLPEYEQQLLTHLFVSHRLVIAEVNQIPDLCDYLLYWRLRLKDHDLPYFCTTMLLDSKPDGTQSKDEEYYLLSDVHPEDRELRSNLLQKRLEKLLEIHAFEREDTNYERECLFCRCQSNTTRASYLNHLFEKHNFYVAKPENLIFVDGLIDLIASKLKNLQCIYCEGVFKDRMILKEHMRKKGHKRINPNNKEYDKYFLVNYLGDKPKTTNQACKKHYHEVQKTKQWANKECDQDSDVDSDPDWSQWTEENGPLITCLLCDHGETEYQSILDHMEQKHDFSFTKETDGLLFYHKIKIVNFIRRQVYLKQCWSCDTKFDDAKNLEKHLKETKHWQLPEKMWDQPEYYFPTYEDDLFLCFINDDNDSWWSSDDEEATNNMMSDDISREMALSVLND